MAHPSMLPQLLRKVDIALRTAVDCVKNSQSQMMSCRDVSNKDTYDEIYRKHGGTGRKKYISYCYYSFYYLLLLFIFGQSDFTA